MCGRIGGCQGKRAGCMKLYFLGSMQPRCVLFVGRHVAEHSDVLAGQCEREGTCRPRAQRWQQGCGDAGCRKRSTAQWNEQASPANKKKLGELGQGRVSHVPGLRACSEGLPEEERQLNCHVGGPRMSGLSLHCRGALRARSCRQLPRHRAPVSNGMWGRVGFHTHMVWQCMAGARAPAKRQCGVRL